VLKVYLRENKIGNEVNYGLMDGKKLTKIDSKAAELGRGEEGTIVKSSKFSDLNESLRKELQDNMEQTLNKCLCLKSKS